MKSVVVDTSVVIKWLVLEEDSLLARRFFLRWSTDGVQRLAPRWSLAEVSNALRQRVSHGNVELNGALDALGELPRFVEFRDTTIEQAKRALAHACQFGHRSVYDMHFLVLAEEMECELWTVDERFWRTVNPAFPFVKWLGGERIAAEQTEEPSNPDRLTPSG